MSLLTKQTEIINLCALRAGEFFVWVVPLKGELRRDAWYVKEGHLQRVKFLSDDGPYSACKEALDAKLCYLTLIGLGRVTNTPMISADDQHKVLQSHYMIRPPLRD